MYEQRNDQSATHIEAKNIMLIYIFILFRRYEKFTIENFKICFDYVSAY